jgi:hypothetical protein
LFPDADEFAGEDADVLVGLLGHGGVALGAFGGLLDERFGFLFCCFELLDVAVEFADVLADEGVAFALLGRVRRVRRVGLGLGTCSSGVGFHRRPLMVSMVGAQFGVVCATGLLGALEEMM